MTRKIKASVRQLVEFTLHGADLGPGGSLRDMHLGMLGHVARQSLLPEGWKAEHPLKKVFEGDGVELTLSGRMDACCEKEAAIEEIKLWQGNELPIEPVPAHWAQAVVYGYLWEKPQVDIRLTYVDTEGVVLASFEEKMTHESCEAVFLPLYNSFMAWHRQLAWHEARRNRNLEALRFPYESYRPGQREMAVQCYEAIRQKKRLFASMPTGTGKSAAVLFPALKALGKGLSGQLFYLTARNTGRQGALDLMEKLRQQPLHLWTLTLEAKDRMCPERTRCHPDFCPLAKGFFDRLPQALEEMMGEGDWLSERVREVALKHQLCPFEFSLSLAEIADVVIGDYNYAFDPGAHLQRVFDRRKDLTLLIDESHHLLGRTRDMLTGIIDGGEVIRLRREAGKAASRRHPLYQAMTAVLKAMENQDTAAMVSPVNILAETLAEHQGALEGVDHQGMSQLFSQCMAFIKAQGNENFAYLWEGTGKNSRLTALCLSVTEHLHKVTKGLRGVICFSATFEPLEVMKDLLGGEGEDACLRLPSPFPRENLLTFRLPIDTRYQAREQTAPQVGDAIRKTFESHPGKYMAFFPSFRYLEQITPYLEGLPLAVQGQGMTSEERAAFLGRFQEEKRPVLGLCVLGGLFSEGIDLAGEKLIGVMIVGVGLPQVNPVQEALREHFNEINGQGFSYAYQIPGMQKITQAVGRVIRSGEDRGVALLIDQRYFQKSYETLCPPHWDLRQGDMEQALESFWQRGQTGA
ncbi:MAG: ATP-dependent DNA helicase [Clostridia bacterium]|nr:ATP-dependent DNA helicase [Clostridia bacterium]